MLFITPSLGAAEQAVIARIEELRRTLRHAVAERRRWVGVIRKVLFARAIQGSNTIEGYTVSLDDAVAAAEGDEPIEADGTSWAAVTGYRDAMTYVLQRADDPYFTYSEDLLRGLHYMMLKYDLTKSPGKWRAGEIFVHDERTGRTVYTGPEPEQVPPLMTEFVSWLSLDEPAIPALVRAGMAHLNLVMIHPFRDGNGRMARCLQTLVLAREGILAAEFSSIEEYLGRNTLDYYRALAEAGGGRWQPERDVRNWIRFTLTAHYRQALRVRARIRESEQLWEALERESTRLGLPERSIAPLVFAADGYRLRNSTYRSMAEVNEATAGRDLAALVKANVLVPIGEKRGRHYIAQDRIRQIRQDIRQTRAVDLDEDPFA